MVKFGVNIFTLFLHAFFRQLDELKVQANKTKNTFNFLVVEDEEAQKTHLGELVC